MLAVPAARLSVGVKVALRVRPVPPIALKTPPESVMSLETKLVPGSSLKPKVMRTVSPFLTAALLLEISSVGAMVSSLTTGVVPAAPRLPAASV